MTNSGYHQIETGTQDDSGGYWCRMCGSLVFPCLDCGLDTLPATSDYQVHDDVWEKAIECLFPAAMSGALCLRCLRQRLGRDLLLEDFMLEYKINSHITQEFLDRINNE